MIHLCQTMQQDPWLATYLNGRFGATRIVAEFVK
jgi:hypothetical protein